MGSHELLECDNPFTPGDGLFPPDLISRHDILRDFETGLEGDYSKLNMRISGPRCSGKTSLLIGLGEVAKKHGWLFISVAGNKPDLLTRIADEISLPRDIQAQIGGSMGTSASFGGISANGNAGVSMTASYVYISARKRFQEYLADPSHKGIVVALDEVQSASSDDIVDICNLMQEMRMQRANVAFIVAGKPGYIRELVNNGRIDYMRKARPFTIGLLNDNEVWLSMREQFKVSGIDIDNDCLNYLVKKTMDFPILVQYIGYEAYDRARIHGKQTDGRNEILSSDCRDIVINAYKRYKGEVLSPIIEGATTNELRFLLAMSSEKGEAKTSAIINESGFDKSLYTFIRASLIEEGIIDAPRRGYLAFSVPFLPAWLKAHRDDITTRINDEEAINRWSTASTTGIDDNDELNDALI